MLRDLPSPIRFTRRASRGGRRGVSIMEVMVVIAILLALVVVMVPAVSAVLQVQERRAAKQLAMLYQRLHDEAVLRNRTFRMVYDLDAGKTKIEVGLARAVIYTDADQRERYEEELTRKLALMDEEERAAYERARQPFEKLEANFSDTFDLPSGLVFGGIYTPQYGKMMTREELPTDPEDGTRLIYSYVFPNGFTEHTVVWLAEKGNPEEGWTIVVEPLSGKVTLHGELVDWEDTIEDIPDEGPRLP